MSPIANARSRPQMSPSFAPTSMNAAITSVYAVIASWTPWIVVSRSATICEIDTFMTLLSSTITNWAAARIEMGSQLRMGGMVRSPDEPWWSVPTGTVDGARGRDRFVTTDTSSTTVKAATPSRGRRRSVLAGIALVLACITILLATLTTWAHQVAFNTDRFTALASDALDDPEVIDPIAQRVTDQVVDALDVQARLQNLLPDRISAAAGPLTLALSGGLERRLQDLLATPRMQQALTRALAITHERVMNLLRDRSNAVQIVNGYVVLEVWPAIVAALAELQSAGIIPADVQLPDPATAESGAIASRLETQLGVTFPEDFGTIQLMPADRVETAKTVVKLFDIIVV